jgi:hypothetical protein
MVNGADHAAAVFTDRTRDRMPTDTYSSACAQLVASSPRLAGVAPNVGDRAST